MSTTKAVLFDADGVIVRPEKLFSHQHAQTHGFDPAEITPFFQGDFQDALVGRADLKDLLEKNRGVWRFDGTPDDLMAQWFQAEHVIDDALVEEVKKLRKLGMHCFLATNQEKYRAKYLEEEMFPGVFEHVYSSAILGVKKPSEEFYAKILDELAAEEIQPEEVVYLDDDAENVEAAKRLGIRAVLYRNIDDFKSVFSAGDVT